MKTNPITLPILVLLAVLCVAPVCGQQAETLAMASIHPSFSAFEPMFDHPEKGDEEPTITRALRVQVLTLSPVGESAVFTIDSLPVHCDVTLSDESGTIQLSFVMSDDLNARLDLTGLPSGPYFLRAVPKVANGFIYTGHLLKGD